MKVVINDCYGGFSLSKEAIKDLGLPEFTDRDIERTNLELIKLIETKGSDYVSGSSAELKVIEFTEKFWHITNYDGRESLYVSDKPINLGRFKA